MGKIKKNGGASMKELVYIAGPINSDSCGTYKNVHNLSVEAISILKMGASVYNPANDLVMGIINGELEYKDYTGNDFPILKRSDCMYLTGNWKKSEGCIKEKMYCEKHGIPVFTDFWDVFDFLNRPIIICIVGESGSGKTYMADYIEDKYQIPMIQSYTTREPRYEGETGHTFISDEEFDKIKPLEMIAFTRFGDHRYCCKHSDVKRINTYIIDEHGYSMLRSLYKDKYRIVSVRVFASKYNRALRDVEPERIERDEGMFILHPKEYDRLISNNGSKELFKKNIDKFIKTLKQE